MKRENAFTHTVWTGQKQYLLKSKLPSFSSSNDPGTALALLQGHCLLAHFAGRRRSSSLACLDFIRGLSKASYLELPPEKSRNAYSSERGRRTFSNTCFCLTPAVCRHVAKVKAAIAPICPHLPANPVDDPPDFDVGRLE